MTEHPNLASALAAFQVELPKVGKGKRARVEPKEEGRRGYEYDYADLADVSAVVLPLLGKHGLSFSSKPTLDEANRFVLSYLLRHSGGEFDAGSYPLPTGRPQDVGSAITYARRYVLSAMTGVAPDGDDDGATAPDVPDVRQRSWDPIEQETLRTAYEAEIEDAKSTEEIAAIGKRVLSAKKSGEISPSTYAHLAKAGAARKAELNGGGHGSAGDRQSVEVSQVQ